MNTGNSGQASSGKRASARERLLAAADELFYGEGVNTVGIDRVIERAGVAKASLYDCFGSKDELIRAYLQAQLASRQARMERKLAQCGTPRDKILGVFDSMAQRIAQPEYRGCPFVRASAEARPGSAVQQVCAESRAWLLGLFTQLARAAGAADPQALGRQLQMLYDGASVSADIDSNRGSAATARAMAELALDAAIR
ncbi:MAG: TetR/AcrR family transcriptional regulator [Nevskia sp.]|nr:TetR/AcrR family transcriptional regulator [Nevskia sp.]